MNQSIIRYVVSALFVSVVLLPNAWAAAKPVVLTGEALARAEARTKRMHDAKWGVFNHFLGYGCKTGVDWNRRVDGFDVEKVANQLATCGARYYFLTLMQGEPWLCAPNATFDRIAGTKPGDYCSRRDLPMELANALAKRGIDLYLYYTGDGPYKNKDVGGKFGFTEPRKAGVTRQFVQNWAAVLEEYAVRYGDKVKGWWIDGCYEWFKYDDALLQIYGDAVHKGNPAALVSYNGGVSKDYFKKHGPSEFTAGEYNDFYVIPRTRFVDGAQAFILAPLGIPPDGREWNGWCRVGCKRSADYMADFVSIVNQNGGVVTVDVKIFPDGSFDPAQLDVLKAIGRRTGTLPLAQ